MKIKNLNNNNRKTKKGFALATTMAVMAVFMALVSVLFVFATSMMQSSKKSENQFLKNYEVMQIAEYFKQTNFVNQDLEYDTTAFENLYPNYSKTENENITTLIGENYILQLSITGEKITLIIKENVKTLANLEKENNIITEWKVYT